VHYIRTEKLLPVYENDSNDIKIVYNALRTIDSQKKTSIEEECVVDVKDCGAAYRFLMALLSATHGKWRLTGTPRLLERPILPLVNFLTKHGAKIRKTKLGWSIEGCELQIDNIKIEASETSQFVSAIMLLQAKSKNRKSQIVNRKPQIVNPYIRMTEAILRMQDLHNSLLPKLADWSAAAFWLANALLNPNTHYLLKDLHFDKLQGDAEVVSFFMKWGLTFTENELGIEIKHINHIEITKQNIDVTYIPDTTMILATLAVCYPFELTMSGLKNLNLKESKRLDILVGELSKFTTIEKHSESIITIHKRLQKLPELFHLNSYNDHRFVMAWSLFKNFGNVVIENPECIRKSYPEFLDKKSFILLSD